MITNIQFWTTACQELNIDHEIYHHTKKILKVIKRSHPYYFVNTNTPFNSQSVSKLAIDKDYTYCLLKDKIAMPKTKGFLYPFCQEKYHKYLTHDSLTAIETDIMTTLSLPVIIKRNSGSMGNNVFLCEKKAQIQPCLEKIFDQNSKNYDCIALAQEYIQISREYRAVFFQNQIFLLYEKNKDNAKFVDNLSPLHWEGAKAKHITDPDLIGKIEDFCQPIFAEIPIIYTGVDIAIDQKGKYWLIEINSSPSFNLFLQNNASQIILDMCKKMLVSWNL